MKHAKFFEAHIHIRKENKREFSLMSRVELDFLGKPTSDKLKRVRGDRLAFRQLMKQMHGIETLQNHIYGDHELPNRY